MIPCRQSTKTLVCSPAAARDQRRRLEERHPANSSVRRILKMMDDQQLAAMFTEHERAGRAYVRAVPASTVEFVPTRSHLPLGELRMSSPVPAVRRVPLAHRTALVSASLVAILAIVGVVGLRWQAQRVLIPTEYSMVVVVAPEPAHESLRAELVRWVRERI
jgi:hypothetical protein